MNPRYTTIITPIDSGQVDELRAYLRQQVEPRYDQRTGEVICQADFRFDRINGLHFCSFVILDEDREEELPACLIFEATFDGTREEFLNELLRVAAGGIDLVYQHCVGYPRSGVLAPQFVKEFFVAHDVGANTFFTGSHGRSASQIKRESKLRGELVRFFADRRRRADPVPASMAGLQQLVQNQFVREQPSNRWAEDPAVVPWQVSYRKVTAVFAVFLALVAAGVLGKLILAARGQNAPDLVNRLHDSVKRLGSDLADGSYYGLQWVGQLGSVVYVPGLYALIALSVVWLLVRLFELCVRSFGKDPRKQGFWWRYGLFLAFVARYVIIVLLVGFAGLAIAQSSDPAAKAAHFPTTTIAVVVVAVIAVLVLRYWSTTLKLQVQLERLPWWPEALRRFGLDLTRFLQVVAVAVAVLAIARHVPQLVALGKSIGPWVSAALAATVYATAGFLVFYAAVLAVALGVRALERGDRRRYAKADELLNQVRPDTRKFAREEGGINRHQNHLASLTYVKPGRLRKWLLRSTLLVIDLLSRFWFNVGELGGIPTILSARWVLIDDDRRLVFLDNYSGAWDSYLDEFIDMGAVKGLNAIWTNSFVKAHGGRRHSFPATDYYLWRGAQAERPFKAYVRQSQIETLVWYSAYRTLSINNINTNTDIRQALFKPLAASEIDAVVEHL